MDAAAGIDGLHHMHKDPNVYKDSIHGESMLILLEATEHNSMSQTFILLDTITNEETEIGTTGHNSSTITRHLGLAGSNNILRLDFHLSIYFDCDDMRKQCIKWEE